MVFTFCFMLSERWWQTETSNKHTNGVMTVSQKCQFHPDLLISPIIISTILLSSNQADFKFIWKNEETKIARKMLKQNNKERD